MVIFSSEIPRKKKFNVSSRSSIDRRQRLNYLFSLPLLRLLCFLSLAFFSRFTLTTDNNRERETKNFSRLLPHFFLLHRLSSSNARSIAETFLSTLHFRYCHRTNTTTRTSNKIFATFHHIEDIRRKFSSLSLSYFLIIFLLLLVVLHHHRKNLLSEYRCSPNQYKITNSKRMKTSSTSIRSSAKGKVPIS